MSLGVLHISMMDDVDDVWHHWAKLFTEVLDKRAPITKKRVRSDQLPWITRGGEWFFKNSGSRKILVEFHGSRSLVF